MNQAKKYLTLEDVISEKGEEWRIPLDHARVCISDKFLTDKNLIRLTKGRCTIAHLELMTKLLYQDAKERPVGVTGIDQFFKIYDLSDFDLYEWLEAITFFNEWMQTRNRKFQFLKMLGYLQCCEESPENKNIKYNFVDLVKDMLEEHDFLG
jgi:hypothetical protein